MRLWIFATQKDLSLPRIMEEAKKAGVDFQTIFFETLSLIDGNLQSEGEPVIIGHKDRLIIRWPFDADDTSIEYNAFVHFLLVHFYHQIAFDKACLQRFSPFYEDKLFQSYIFRSLSIPTPKTYYFQRMDDFLKAELSLPLVLKKRVSSRSKNNFLIYSREELKEKLRGKNMSDYIFQEIIEIDHDVRIIALQDKIIGAAKRFTHLRDGNRLAVKGGERLTKIPEVIQEKTMTYMRYLGADFVGFDVLLTKKNEYYFIEANLSPQINPFEDATGIPLSKYVVQALFAKV